MADCHTCALQYQEACPHQFGDVPVCNKYVEKHFDPQPPRRGGRHKPEPGEYPRGQRTPPLPVKTSTRSIVKSKPNRPVGRTPKHPDPARDAPKVKAGQRLFYRDKNTGIIQNGIVTSAYKDGFYYAFDGKRVFLRYDVLGTRLFFSWKGARHHYKKNKDGNS